MGTVPGPQCWGWGMHRQAPFRTPEGVRPVRVLPDLSSPFRCPSKGRGW